MTWTVIIALILAGILFLLLEILVLPGSTFAGIIGFALMGIAIWQAYEVYGTTSGHICLGATIAATVLVLYFSLKSKTWKKMTLKSSIDGRVNIIDDKAIKAGDEGVTVSRLAPSGKALIGDQIYEVHTYSEFIDPDTEIIVKKIDGKRIFVKHKK